MVIHLFFHPIFYIILYIPIFTPFLFIPDFLSHLFADPCAIKNCGTGFTCNGGICYCGTTICSSATANVCDAGTCKCGASSLCAQTGTDDQQCLSTTGAVPAIGDTTATCQVKLRRIRKYTRSKSLNAASKLINLYFFPIFQCTAASCLTATGADPTKPYCATATSHAGNPALGMCGSCMDSDGVMGTNANQGSCTSGICCSSGKCEAMASAC